MVKPNILLKMISVSKSSMSVSLKSIAGFLNIALRNRKSESLTQSSGICHEGEELVGLFQTFRQKDLGINPIF